ncbi:MAG: hypothetical protein COZ06_17570 [Armatimonadetes bacterium CG_4_10_14_3_um_filter_66_18]|nr:universal stress protein [Armatimonadota bacterium]OIP08087.1 MAG: hypothetical protein AUJ96_06365 [Armatimonadetes bacterium CG2_30_66_41]PIU95130.1 MAG: hypothetical protein COS65_03860 [Armatimonadetes bacterium CG06_land_8_20_14_3_00_66_21]PIX38485.1 MAG: hypothetical protein COZ57_30485 [Armatimonadetes bacterium CG_4_8_14_3_um_filter_66_20]PIY47827.1 MAG: hypothetical protein COZ06_17570 [Armatimonadetes bacterium CG_4_10_14_3_um_filter_66_18]PIZ36009.1 MAG: hypothetical protein COY4
MSDYATFHPQHVLCPVNLTDAAQVGLQHAAALARRFGATLTVLYSVEGEAPLPPSQVREAVSSWIPDPLVAATATVEPIVRHGHAAEQILADAAEHDLDLIVLAAQRWPFLQASLFSSTTELILRQAPIPVLVAPVPLD